MALEMGEAHLSWAVPLLARLGDSRRFFVQGERWHGGCCVDTVGDAHAGADAVVHFGEWCFAVPSGLGLLLEPDRHPLPPLPSPPPGCRLLAHLSLAHHEPALTAYAALHGLHFEPVPLEYHPGRGPPPPHRPFDADGPVLYVSPLEADPRCVLLSLSAPELLVAGPARAATSAALFFGRRMAAVRRCREARATALLAVSPGAPGTADQLRSLAAEVRAAGRVPYTLCVGKAGPIKLLNLPGLSVFVLVGCPLSTLLLAESLASAVCTLVTPLEHALACRPDREWQPLFLFGNPVAAPSDDDDDDDDKEDDGPAASSSRALIFTNNEIARVSPAAALLRQPGRWVGVDPATSHLEAAAAVPGRSGIASQYTHEPQLQVSKDKPGFVASVAMVAEAASAPPEDLPEENVPEELAELF